MRFDTLVNLLEAKTKKPPTEITPVEVFEKAYKKKKRIPELEHILLHNRAYSVYYARYVIKGRWPELEKVLLERYNPHSIFDELVQILDYAKYAIKGRWPEAEHLLLTDPKKWSSYVRYLKKSKYSDLEESTQ